MSSVTLYLQQLLLLARLEELGLADGPLAETVRGEMDLLWPRLNEPQRDAIVGVGEALNQEEAAQKQVEAARWPLG